MHIELRFASAEGGEYAEGDQLAVARGQAGTVVDLTEGPSNDLVAEFG